MENVHWLAMRAIMAETQESGFQQLGVDIGDAIKIRLSKRAIDAVRFIADLPTETLARLGPQSRFPEQRLWVEWPMSFFPSARFVLPIAGEIPPKSKEDSFGILIQAAKNGQTGLASLLSFQQNICLVPLSLQFNWIKNFELPKKLADFVEESSHKTRTRLAADGHTQEHIAGVLDLRRRFFIQDSPYLPPAKRSMPEVEKIVQFSAKFIEPFGCILIGLANVLECCTLSDWAETDINVN